jgi:hypothetical protein
MSNARYIRFELAHIEMKAAMEKMEKYLDGEEISPSEFLYLRQLYSKCQEFTRTLDDAVNVGDLNDDFTW